HLTRSIVDLHHGTIKAENNKDGRGCRFIIRIPLGNSHLRAEEMEEKVPVPLKQDHFIQPLPLPDDLQEQHHIKSKSNYRVLIVDDDAEIRKYVKEELSTDYHMVESSNGK